jgi:hypothetical protein
VSVSRVYLVALGWSPKSNRIFNANTHLIKCMLVGHGSWFLTHERKAREARERPNMAKSRRDGDLDMGAASGKQVRKAGQMSAASRDHEDEEHEGNLKFEVHAHIRTPRTRTSRLTCQACKP